MTSIMNDTRGAAALVLSDGTVFHGKSVGAPGTVSGLVVFNTDEFGYEEILTDPHYAGKIVTLTYPEIGNVGVNAQDVESARGHAAGLVVRAMSSVMSNFRAEKPLSTFLKAEGIVAIADIDTRALVRRLRQTGAQNGTIVAVETGLLASDAVDAARAAAEAFTDTDFVSRVSCDAPYEAVEGAWLLKGEEGVPTFKTATAGQKHVVAVDLGICRDTLRDMVEAKMSVTVVPAASSVETVLAAKPDGVFLSNGPGGANALDAQVALVKALLAKRIPVFGVGLGAQVLARAVGAKVKALHCGHYGTNHPVRDCESRAIAMVKQDAIQVVDAETLPKAVRVTHESLFDGSVQGFAIEGAMGYQGTPQAGVWNRFFSMMGGCR